jgi:hypothetical protein
VRAALTLVAALALAGCGGQGKDPAPPVRDVAGQPVRGEVRSPDARTPLVRGGGVWQCDTAGRVELRIGAEGSASLALAGQLLATTSAAGPLVSRACAPRRPAALTPPGAAVRAATGAARLRCRVPRRVLVELHNGDLIVRAGGRGRFLAGAAVGPDHLAVAGYWSTGCSAG